MFIGYSKLASKRRGAEGRHRFRAVCSFGLFNLFSVFFVNKYSEFEGVLPVFFDELSSIIDQLQIIHFPTLPHENVTFDHKFRKGKCTLYLVVIKTESF